MTLRKIKEIERDREREREREKERKKERKKETRRCRAQWGQTLNPNIGF